MLSFGTSLVPRIGMLTWNSIPGNHNKRFVRSDILNMLYEYSLSLRLQGYCRE
jgi:hypothetical protein